MSSQVIFSPPTPANTLSYSFIELFGTNDVVNQKAQAEYKLDVHSLDEMPRLSNKEWLGQ